MGYYSGIMVTEIIKYTDEADLNRIIEQKKIEGKVVQKHFNRRGVKSAKFVAVQEWREKYINEKILARIQKRINETDKYCFADVWEELTAQERQRIKDYRQELRDLPDTLSNIEKPEDVVWPEKPNVQIRNRP